MTENLRAGVSKRSSTQRPSASNSSEPKPTITSLGACFEYTPTPEYPFFCAKWKWPLRPAISSNRPATSSAWALTSCRQIQSGWVFASHASTPFVAAERMPFALRLVSLNKDLPMGIADGGRDALAQEFVQF